MKDRESRRMLGSFLPGFLFVIILWLVKSYEWKSGHDLSDWGIFPRTLSGLPGILFSPLLHGDFSHLISNTPPLLVLGAGMFYFYPTLAFRVFIWVYFLGDFWLWLGGRSAYHIGASGIVYGLTVFLFLSGLFRRDTRLMAFSMLVVFLYGGLVWGLLPLDEKVSWEAHLFGSLAGILMAAVYRREGPQRKKYSWDFNNDEDVDDGPDAYWRNPVNSTSETSVPPQD